MQVSCRNNQTKVSKLPTAYRLQKARTNLLSFSFSFTFVNQVVEMRCCVVERQLQVMTCGRQILRLSICPTFTYTHTYTHRHSQLLFHQLILPHSHKLTMPRQLSIKWYQFVSNAEVQWMTSQSLPPQPTNRDISQSSGIWHR